MDLNQIKLPAFVVSALYKQVLVQPGDQTIDQAHPLNITTETIVGSMTSNKSWESMGDNLRNVLVVVNNPGLKYMPEEDLQFLTGVLAACKLSLTDVAIVNLSNYPLASYKELLAYFKSKIVFLVAVSPVEFGLPMNFPFYQIQPFAGSSFLYSPSLNQLINDKSEKGQLWTSLKRLFNL